MNIQCAGFVRWPPVFSESSLAEQEAFFFFLPFLPQKDTHTHRGRAHTQTLSRTRSSLSYNSVWKSNLILAALMNIHPHLLPAETFQQVPLPLRQEFGPGLLCVLARTSTPCTTCAHYSAAVVSVGLMRSDSRYLLLIFFSLSINSNLWTEVIYFAA